MKWPKIQVESRYLYLLGGTGGLLALLLLVRFLYLPVIARIGEQRAILTDLRVKTSDANVLIGQRPHHEATLHALRRRYRALVENRLGTDQSVARVLDALSQEAKGHRLELAATQATAAEATQHFMTLGQGMTLREVPLALQLSGRYRKVGEFLGGLREAPFIASVEQVTLTRPQADSSKLKTDVILAVYLPAAPQQSGGGGAAQAGLPERSPPHE